MQPGLCPAARPPSRMRPQGQQCSSMPVMLQTPGPKS
jgi:hypothetical protein